MVKLVKAEEFINVEVDKSNLPFKKAIKWVSGKTIAPWLTKFARLDEINEIISSGANKFEGEFNDHVIQYFDLKITEKGVENLPIIDGAIKGRDYVVLANHPLGGLDGILLMHKLDKYTEPSFLVGKNLMYLENFGRYFAPVKGYSPKEMRKAYVNLMQVVNSDRLLVAFPAGLSSRMNEGVLKDVEWQTGSVKIIENERNIIPVYVDAKNPDWFYKKMKKIDPLAKRSKIFEELKFMYQPRAIFDNKGASIGVVYGKPISYEYFVDKTLKEQHEMLQIVKEHVYRLKEDSNVKFEDTLKMYS